MHKILIVEDEEAIRLGLVDLLEIEGYEIAVAVDGEEAMEKVRQFLPHLVILDLMLPKVSGYDVCRYIRKTFPQTFIMMLTAKNEEINKIQGLEIGADDYVTKPFSVFELMARLKSMLRRVSQDTVPAPTTPDILEFHDVRIDFRKYEASRGGKPMELSAKEFQILKYLSTRRGEVVTREDLLQAIWGYSIENMPTTRTVDNQIVKLRQKIEADTENPLIIKSVRGVGYKFDPPEAGK
ncbi:MAG: two component transcriptional regulator, winged helix family [Fibrobacteres bacterium]|nr:two component transcriptional regulator, winged helix family [Fibrobacterota bacterium]